MSLSRGGKAYTGNADPGRPEFLAQPQTQLLGVSYEYRLTYALADTLERHHTNSEEEARRWAQGAKDRGCQDVRLFRRPRQAHWERFAEDEFPGASRSFDSSSDRLPPPSSTPQVSATGPSVRELLRRRPTP